MELAERVCDREGVGARNAINIVDSKLLQIVQSISDNNNDMIDSCPDLCFLMSVVT